MLTCNKYFLPAEKCNLHHLSLLPLLFNFRETLVCDRVWVSFPQRHTPYLHTCLGRIAGTWWLREFRGHTDSSEWRKPIKTQQVQWLGRKLFSRVHIYTSFQLLGPMVSVQGRVLGQMGKLTIPLIRISWVKNITPPHSPDPTAKRRFIFAGIATTSARPWITRDSLVSQFLCRKLLAVNFWLIYYPSA